jgi:hypothetical protein
MRAGAVIWADLPPAVERAVLSTSGANLVGGSAFTDTRGEIQTNGPGALPVHSEFLYWAKIRGSFGF